MAHLALKLLGPLEITLAGAPIAFRYDKVRALVAYLAGERASAHTREHLIGLLWPESPNAEARRNLSQALFNLRQALGEGSAAPAPATPFLLVGRDHLQFNIESDYNLDVAEFEALLEACGAHAHESPTACAECAERLERALDLYRGDFLQHFFVPDSATFEEWALLKREDLRRQALGAMARLTASFEQQGEYENARRYARRQLRLEPWREETHRDLMRLLAHDGQRSAALAQYEICRKALADELGVGPSAETEALLEQIRAGELQGRRAGAEPGARLASPASPTALRLAPLPAPVTAFVGRERELAQIGRLLADPNCRLLTLTGPGGIGKTRLAIQAAAAQRSAFADGAAWVALAPIGSPEEVFTAIADAVGLNFHAGAEPKVQLAQHLCDKTLLLVLDNFEHLLAGSAGVVWLVELLASAPRLKVLATSREALNLHSEWLFAVEGLGDEAVALFVQSARRARAAFELREAEAASVARICALLGTTPLAVELAAAWVRVLNCAEIAEEIERTFDSGQALAFLSTPAHDVPEGHRSMAAVFDHSWRLLSADEQSVLGRLALFRGGFGRAAAEQVAGATLAVLSALSAKSLLRRVNAWRYDLHELVRQFAADKLAQVPEELTRAHDEHCNFYARFLAERAEDLRGSRQREAALEIAAELDNVHAAWGWAVKHDRIAALQQAAVPMYLFAQRRSRYQEGAALLTQAIARLEGAVTDEGQEVLASLLLGRGWLGIRLGQLDAAAADLQRSQDLYTRLNRLPHPRMIGDPIMALGVIASIRGDYAAATQHYEAALEVITPHGDHQALAYPHLYLASVQRARGDYAAAERYAQQAHRLALAANQPWLLGFVLNELGQVAQARGDCADAQKHFQAAYALREKVGDAAGMALDLSHLGQVALSRNDIVEAEHLLQRSLAMYHDIGDQGGLVTALHGLGRTAAAAGRYSAAWANLTQALEIANRASFVPVTLSILVDLAEVLLESGNNERARQLVDVVLSQSNYDQATRNGAERIARRLGIPTLIEPTSPARDLAGTIAALLADPL